MTTKRKKVVLTLREMSDLAKKEAATEEASSLFSDLDLRMTSCERELREYLDRVKRLHAELAATRKKLDKAKKDKEFKKAALAAAKERVAKMALPDDVREALSTSDYPSFLRTRITKQHQKWLKSNPS